MERKRLLPYVILQIIPLLILPPSMLLSSDGSLNIGALTLVAALAGICVLLGVGLMRGRGWALTMSIFMQGLNLIVRLMMIFPNSVTKQGVWDVPLMIAFLVAIVLSGWLMVRLDRPDIRSMIVS